MASLKYISAAVLLGTNLSFCSAQTADQVRAWLTRHTPDRPHPPIHRPINWMRIVVTTVAVTGVATLVATTFRYIQPVIQNRNLWAAVTLIAIILFTSGHMFNHIRKVPYITQDQRGRIAYFTGGFQSQLGIETQIVAAMCKFRAPPEDISSST